MGSYEGSRAADLEYPVAFLRGMDRVLEPRPPRPRFRYVHLGGMFTKQDQETKLWFLEYPRKIRVRNLVLNKILSSCNSNTSITQGLGEAKVLEFGSSNDVRWRIFVVRPGGVATKAMIGSRTLASILGQNWLVRIEELGAFMAYLAIDGEESAVIENPRIVGKGRELLKTG